MKYLRSLWTSMTPPGRIAIAIGLLVLLAVIAGCTTAPKLAQGDKQITVKADRVAQCEQQGGCALLTQAEVLGMLNEAVQAGAVAAMAELDTNGCKRGSL